MPWCGRVALITIFGDGDAGSPLPVGDIHELVEGNRRSSARSLQAAVVRASAFRGPIRRDAAANLRHIGRHGRSCGQHLFAMIERIPLPASLLHSDSEAAHDCVASVYGCQFDYFSRAVLFLGEFDVQSLVKPESRTM